MSAAFVGVCRKAVPSTAHQPTVAGEVWGGGVERFLRGARGSTPQQRRILAGEIAVVIPSEGMMQGHPDPLWLQSLRAFARRELDLDQLSQDAPPSERGGAEARALVARITETIGEMIDEVGQGQQISLNKDEVARRLHYADRKGLEFAMSRCSLDWKPFQWHLRSLAKNAYSRLGVLLAKF